MKNQIIEELMFPEIPPINSSEERIRKAKKIRDQIETLDVVAFIKTKSIPLPNGSL